MGVPSGVPNTLTADTSSLPAAVNANFVRILQWVTDGGYDLTFNNATLTSAQIRELTTTTAGITTFKPIDCVRSSEATSNRVTLNLFDEYYVAPPSGFDRNITTKWVMPRAGSIVGYSNFLIKVFGPSLGSFYIRVKKGSTTLFNTPLITVDSEVKTYNTFSRGTYTFSAGDTLNATIVADVSAPSQYIQYFSIELQMDT